MLNTLGGGGVAMDSVGCIHLTINIGQPNAQGRETRL